MLNLLVRYRIITNRSATITAGHYINVYWDDVADALEVQDFDNASDTTGTVITSGPDLGANRVDFIPYSVTVDRDRDDPFIPYKFCDGSALQTFQIQSQFPYVNKISSPGHFSCAAAVVCDLQIADNPTIQPASDFVTPNGSVQGTATSSNGAIKFSLDPNFYYNTEGVPTFEFYNLFPGEHTITAKDASGCVDQITITIPIPDFYNPLYRLEYTDVHDIPTRVDILERGYTGDVIEVCGDGDPFILKYNGDGELNKFTPIIPSQATLTLMAETNFYFRHLFTQDERKYQLRYYKDYGNSVAPFTPAVLPGLSSWTNVPNPSISGWDWNTGATPTVDFGNAGSGFAHGLNTRSDLLYTAYTFVSGKNYSFAYNFIGITSPSGYNPVNATYKIQIVDVDKNVLIEKNVPYSALDGASTGTYDFIAPTGATGIAIVVFVASAGSQHTYSIQSFINETESESGGAAGFELKWLGYLISSNNSEAYVAPPYPVTIVATDGLADIKTYDFLDSGENRFREDIITFDAIREILLKTDLDINIQSAINRFEEGMSVELTDDPLPQCKFDPTIFYDGEQVANCFDVLSEILKPFGARILQRNGKWFIYSIEELVTTALYREFDTNGLFAGNGSVLDLVDIDVPIVQQVAVFRNRDQVLETLPSYGKMFFEHTLLPHASLVKSHGFELEDIGITPGGVTFFNDWNVNISNHPGATYGIKETNSSEGDFNFYAKRGFIDDGIDSGLVILTSKAFLIEYEATDAFEYRFNYSVILSNNTDSGVNFINPLWVKLKWMLKIGDYYFNEQSGTWTNDADYKYNNIYCKNFNETQEFKIVGAFRNVTALTLEVAQVEFVFTYDTTVDFLVNTGASDALAIAALKNIATTKLQIGHRVKGHIEYTGTSGSLEKDLYWIIVDDDAADDGIEVVRPNDFNATTNGKVWNLEDQLQSYKSRSRTSPLNDNPVREGSVQYNYLDNVILRHLPDGSEPPGDITIERENNPGIKINFEDQYLLNDIDIDNINNSERTYKNYFKKLDGTPTQIWERTYRPGIGKLLDLHSGDFFSQYKLPSNKLTGSIISDVEVLPTSVLNEVNDGGRKYMFMGYELHDKEYSIGFDLHEIKDVITDSGSGNIDAEFNTDFSLDFNS